MLPRPDLDTPAEIARLVPLFYGRVSEDPLLGHVFNEVAGVDWDSHMPKLVAFWSQMLLRIPGFRGDPAGKHVENAKKEPFTKDHFDRWVGLFLRTIDEGWSGPKSDELKALAVQIAGYPGTSCRSPRLATPDSVRAKVMRTPLTQEEEQAPLTDLSA